MNRMKYLFSLLIVACGIVACSGSANQAESEKKPENVYTKLSALNKKAVVDINSAASLTELDSINDQFAKDYDKLRNESFTELLEIEEERAKNPEAYQEDIDAEKASWTQYEDAYLNKLSELR